MPNFVLICGITLISLCTLCIATPTRPLSQSDREGMIFIRGKWFNRNGKSNLPLQQTPPQIFKQCMHHLNASGCSTTWNQRYWVRRDYYDGTGPIFFQFGGEGPADGIVDTYHWHTYAAEYKALLIVLEHRFYGQSFPTFDSSYEDLQLLTSQQALADAAKFIEDYTEENNLGNASWVAFGGSYAGNLAAWMKAKYPQHVKAAVASSGPVEPQLDFPGYLETVSEVVKQVDEKCYEQIYSAFECMESLVNGSGCMGYTNAFQIPVVLQQCYLVNFNNQLDRETYFNILSMDTWADNWPADLIKNNCLNLTTGVGTNALEDYGNFLVRIGKADGDCKAKSSKVSLKSKTDEILEFIRSKEGRQSGAAGWFWQTCFEFGYYMSADPKHGLFGYETFSDLPYSSSCVPEYGSRFTREFIQERIDMTNEYYEGKNLNVNCTIFVNGMWDPWHTLGINNASETSERNTVVYIPDAMHCDDMLPPKTQDMVSAQAKIQAQIGIYLNDPTC